jgi:sugar phosphate isomerase/epimerase
VFQDIDQIHAAGFAGVGLDELKLPPGSDALAHEVMQAAGLTATYVTPAVWPIVSGPLDQPGQPIETPARVDAICASIERFSSFRPLGVIVGAGRSGDPDHPAGSVEEIGRPLDQIARVTASYGLNVALEVLPRRKGSALSDIAEAVALLDGLGHPHVGLLIDVAHVWDAPGRDHVLQEYAARVHYVQLNDVRPAERTWADRLLPGDGLAQAPGVIAALLRGGYRGWYELEVFSDDGTFGVELEDSLWKRPHIDLLHRGREQMGFVLDQAAALCAEPGDVHGQPAKGERGHG